MPPGARRKIASAVPFERDEDSLLLSCCPRKKRTCGKGQFAGEDHISDRRPREWQAEQRNAERTPVLSLEIKPAGGPRSAQHWWEIPFCTSRSVCDLNIWLRNLWSKRDGGRSLLYRSRCLQRNPRWKTLDEIYQIYNLLRLFGGKFSANVRC